MLATNVKLIAGCVLAAGALGLGSGVWTRPSMEAGPTAAQVVSAPHAGPTKVENAPDKSGTIWEKKYSFEMRDVPWMGVLEWLGDKTNLPLNLTGNPKGTLTFIPPRNDVQYTLLEIIDVLNDALRQKNEILVRGGRSLTLVAADKKIDPDLLRQIRPEELAKQGATELVSIVLPLKNINAKDIAADAKKMLGTFGELKVLETSNKLIVQDTAGNLRRVYEMVQDLEKQRRSR